MNKVPITVFTGYLGSGKTTIILNLIKQLPGDYKVVWLKNEYGSVNIDGELAKESNVQTKEIMNGCLCCVLVGRLGNALKEIVDTYAPDRIIVESSGTAYPLPIVLEIAKLVDVELDAVLTVVDCVNFSGYRDVGAVAQMQSAATDIFLLNKHEIASEQQIEAARDAIYELNPETPQLRADHGWVAKDLVFGLDEREVRHNQAAEDASSADEHGHGHHPDEVEVVEYVGFDKRFTKSELEVVLNKLKNLNVLRVKGILRFGDEFEVLNWVFGRGTWQPLPEYVGEQKLVVMYEEGAAVQPRLNELLGLGPKQQT